MKVLIYFFEGTYSGASNIDYNHPESGSAHKGILFLRQQSEELDFDFAHEKIAEFGFKDFELRRGSSLTVESLNDPKMQKFSSYYEEALECGSSLVWYP